MQGFGLMLEKIGTIIGNLGWKFCPISALAYFIVGICMYKMNMRYKLKFVKALWYLTNAMLLIDGDMRVETIAIIILFFEAYDNILDWLEERKGQRAVQ